MRWPLIALLCATTACAGGGVSDACEPGTVLRNGACVAICTGDSGCAPDLICQAGACTPGVRPVVTAVSPADLTIGVDLMSLVVLTFPTPMDEVLTSGAFSLTGTSGLIAGAIEWNDSSLVMTFSPVDPFIAGTAYVVQMAQTAVSQGGVVLAETFQSSFTAFLPPTAVVESSPVPGAVEVGVRPVISVLFSAPMEGAATRDAFSLTTGLGTVEGNKRFDVDGTTLIFEPGAPLNFNATYTLKVATTATSVDGAQITTAYEATFSTITEADALPPGLVVEAVTEVISAPDLDTTGAFTFSGSASDAQTAVESVLVQVVPAGQQAQADGWLVTDTSASSWSFRWFPLAATSLPDGSFTLQVRAIDKGGNETKRSIVFAADLVAPAVPTFQIPPKTVTKFLDQSVQIRSEAESTLEVRLDNLALGGSFSTGASGIAQIDFQLATLGISNLSVFAVDSEGNRNDTPLIHSVEKKPYDCLAGAGFPLPAASVLSITDDKNGGIEVRYRLESGLVRDAQIRSATATTNFGTGQYMNVTGTSYRALIAPDADFFPGCAQIDSAVLRLSEDNNTLDEVDVVEVFLLLTSWVESEVTWTNRNTATAWNQAGAGGMDRGKGIGQITREAAVVNGDDIGAIDLTLLARNWALFPATNHGVLLVGDAANVRFSSSDAAAEQRWPTLTLKLLEPEAEL